MALLTIAMPSAATVITPATANVIRIPIETASGRTVVMSIVPDANANTAPMTDAPVTRPMLRDRLSIPEMTPRCSRATPAMTSVLLAVWNSA
jgi:hypothetical protein